MIARARAMYRGYYEGSRRAGQVGRLHVIRDKGPAGWEDGKQAWCGQAAWKCENSPPVILDPIPSRPPDGLRWCPACIGHLAERYGLLDEVAASVAAYDPGLSESYWNAREAEYEAARLARRAVLLGGAG